MRYIVNEIFMGWTVEKIIFIHLIIFYYCLPLPSNIEYELVYIILICFDSSDIGGRSLSSPNAEMHDIIPCNPWF